MRKAFHLLRRIAPFLLLTLAIELVSAQNMPSSESKIPLRAALILTPDFCTGKVAHGAQENTKRGLEVGKVACVEFEPALRDVFADLVTVTDEQKAGEAQLVLIPKFVDAAVTMEGITAFANQDLLLFLQWTVKDASGRTLWLETVQGSARRHVGNIFTARKNERLIIQDAVKDLAAQSATHMSTAPELQKAPP
jgi:hypothetical protein